MSDMYIAAKIFCPEIFYQIIKTQFFWLIFPIIQGHQKSLFLTHFSHITFINFVHFTHATDHPKSMFGVKILQEKLFFEEKRRIFNKK